MTYDPTPYYERAEKPTQSQNIGGSEVIRPTPKVWTGLPIRSYSDPSLTFRWYHRENALRQKGEMNEIDIAEIKAGSMGVLNKYFKVAKAEPRLIDQFVNTPTVEKWLNINEIRLKLDKSP